MINLTNIKQDNFLGTTLYETLQDKLTAQASSGQAVVSVTNGAQFSVGQCLILYNLEGNFETVVIQSKAGNNLTMTANLANTYQVGASIGRYLGYIDTLSMKYGRKQAPDLGTGADGAFVSTGNATWSTDKNFTSITILNGHTITINADVTIKCQGAVDIQAGGKLSAKGQGHAGGSYGSPYSRCGTSELGFGPMGSGTTRIRNGGGGGGCSTSGYGQGAHSGGGGGGYGTAGGDGSNEYYGLGGAVYNDAQMSNETTAFMKGAGGGGGASGITNYGGSGGNGGGIIKLNCRTLTVASTGDIDCDGNPGDNGQALSSSWSTGGGGGGAGGSIKILVLISATINTSRIHAIGGIGGMSQQNGVLNYASAGGAGGMGRIRIECPNISGTSNPTLNGGYSSGWTGNAKYGFYFTKKYTVADDVTTANAYVKQKAVTKTVTGAVGSAQAVVNVSDGSIFEAGDIVVIKEGDKVERKTILSVAVNALTMTTNFANSYTTSAVVFRIDVRGYCSMVDTGANENLLPMTMKDIYFLTADAYLQITFSKTIKSVATDVAGKSFIGMIMVKGKVSGDTVDNSLAEVSFEYF